MNRRCWDGQARGLCELELWGFFMRADTQASGDLSREHGHVGRQACAQTMSDIPGFCLAEKRP